MVSLIYEGHAFGFPCIHISDRWLKIMDIHNSVMDTIILNYGQLFIGKHAYPQLFAFGIPSIHIPDWKKKENYGSPYINHEYHEGTIDIY